MPNSTLVGIKDDMLRGSRIKTKPYADAPPRPISTDSAFLCTTLVLHTLAEHVQFTCESSPAHALPSCPAIGPNNVSGSEESDMPGQPRQQGMSDWHMSLEMLLQAELMYSHSTLDQFHRRLCSAIGLRIVRGRAFVYNVDTSKLHAAHGCGDKLENGGLVVTQNGPRPRRSQPATGKRSRCCRGPSWPQRAQSISWSYYKHQQVHEEHVLEHHPMSIQLQS